VVLKTRTENFFADISEETFFRIVKAGFSAKRKMLRGSLSGGLGISKADAEIFLKSAGISPESRAEDLDLDAWVRLAKLPGLPNK
jgi:16S rRNA (adenine1518-N6/adenine1519-N6)-dimethyltransferase